MEKTLILELALPKSLAIIILAANFMSNIDINIMDEQEIDHKRQLLRKLKERNHHRELQKASLGISADPSILMEQQELAEQIKDLENQLLLLQQEPTEETINVSENNNESILSTHAYTDFSGYYDFSYGVEVILYQVYKIMKLDKEVFRRIRNNSSIEKHAIRRYFSFIILIIGLVILTTSIVLQNIALSIVFLFLIMFSFLVASRRYRAVNKRIDVLREGLHIVSNNTMWSFLWVDIIEVYYYRNHSEKLPPYLVSAVVTNDGGYHYISSDISQHERLSTSIEDETSEVVYNRALSSYKLGKPVRFGSNLTIKDNEIHFEDKLVRLDDLRDVRFSAGKLVIRKKGVVSLPIHVDIELEDLPNVNVFRELIKDLTK